MKNKYLTKENVYDLSLGVLQSKVSSISLSLPWQKKKSLIDGKIKVVENNQQFRDRLISILVDKLELN